MSRYQIMSRCWAMANAKTLRVIVELRRQGFSVTLTARGHLRVKHTNMNGVVICGGSPSDWRWKQNLNAAIKRKMREGAACST